MTGLFGGSTEFQKQDSSSQNAPPASPQAKTPSPARPAAATKISFNVDPNPPKGADKATFAVTITDPNGKPVPDAKVRVTLVMPAMPSMGMPEMRNSFELPWAAARRMYIGEGKIPAAGPWNVTVEAMREGEIIATQRTRLNAK
jgi:hypothetical protein